MVARRSQKPRDPARRQRILEAARRHFTQHGFKGTNLDAVAAEAGCAKGALYLEFADKESLLREVVEQSFAAIGARYAEEVMSIASPLERLVATLRFAYRQIEEGKAQLAMIRGWVDEGIARGEIRADIDRDAVPIVIGVLRFAPQHLGMIAELGLFSTERALDALVDVFRAGLAAPKSPPPTKRAGPTPKRRSKR